MFDKYHCLFILYSCLQHASCLVQTIGTHGFQHIHNKYSLCTIDQTTINKDHDNVYRLKGNWGSTLGTMAVVSAPLGMALDNQHGLFNVLNYFDYNLSVIIDNEYYIKSAYWVPLLFGFAGFAMTFIILFLDGLKSLNTPVTLISPSWHKVFYGISLFSAQYYMSGALDYLQYDPLIINAMLSTVAIGGFIYFDGSISGLVLSVATALAGPVAEIILINVFHLYSYTHADIYGICSWIPAVYFCGGQAVGNLARKLYSMSELNHE